MIKYSNILKFMSIYIIIILSLSLSSCSSQWDENKKIADKRFNNIIKALDNKDNDGLKKMFSPNALKKAKDIDGGIDYIMKFFQGKIQSKDGDISSSETFGNGEQKNELDCKYIVTTDVDKYIVFFIDKLVDTKNPDKVGLYMLQIIKESDREKEFDWGGTRTYCAGIYCPN